MLGYKLKSSNVEGNSLAISGTETKLVQPTATVECNCHDAHTNCPYHAEELDPKSYSAIAGDNKAPTMNGADKIDNIVALWH